MAERPILFNTEMVKAILDGRKKQTRRLVKGIPLYEPYFTVEDGKPFICDDSGDWHPAEEFSRIQPGDVLWVRETWNGVKTGNPKVGFHTTYWYKADDKDENPDDSWRPSIHMPKDAARLFLRAKAVHMERLQGMTVQDSLDEGVKLHLNGIADGADPLLPFAELWNSTINKRDFSKYCWSANPWVWVIEFERIDHHVDRGFQE